MASFLTRHFSWFSCPRFHFLKWWTRKNYEINSEQPAVRKEEQSRSRFPAGGRISGFQIRFLDKKRGEKHKLLTGFLKGWLGSEGAGPMGGIPPIKSGFILPWVFLFHPHFHPHPHPHPHQYHVRHSLHRRLLAEPLARNPARGFGEEPNCWVPCRAQIWVSQTQQLGSAWVLQTQVLGSSRNPLARFAEPRSGFREEVPRTQQKGSLRNPKLGFVKPTRSLATGEDEYDAVDEEKEDD
ncbi:hypothetical protein SLEP1_g19024 [Rubroshorea leprosula]|nr:hypothetical protein SLEP1_g19024 [Rubroshorea leprosula]